MTKTFLISVLVLAFVSLMSGFLVHGLLLKEAYVLLPNLFRSDADAQNYFGYMLLAHLLIGLGLTWTYRLGRESGKAVLAQGLRFGVAVA